MADLDRETFAKGVNDAIRALRAVYMGVRTMLDELSGTLERGPAPSLYDLGVRLSSGTSRANPDERILRSWMGRIFLEAPTESEPDEESEEDDEEVEQS